MKLSSVLLSVALTLALGSAAWLASENSRLQTELGEVTVQKIPVRAVRNVTGSGMTFGPRNPASTPLPAKTTGSADVTGAKNTGVPADPFPPGALKIVDNGDSTYTVSDPAGSWQRVMTTDELHAFRQQVDSTMQASVTKMPGGPSWSPGRAAGPPDTAEHGDYATAWASQSPDAGKEWLQLKYPKPVEVREVNIHESYNPGALAKVSAIMPDGSERVIWEGVEAPEEGVIERAVKVPPGIRSDQIRIELDTSRVPGWNEIDAVELVGADGSRQWASESTASSYYGQSRGAGLSHSDALQPDIFIEVESLGGLKSR